MLNIPVEVVTYILRGGNATTVLGQYLKFGQRYPYTNLLPDIDVKYAMDAWMNSYKSKNLCGSLILSSIIRFFSFLFNLETRLCYM